MNIEKTQVIYFSPTGTSKRVVQAIADGFDGAAAEETDVTYPGFTADRRLAPNDLAIVGVPVYAGRVAPLAVERMKHITGSDTPAVIVAVYGNRAFEDALVELRDIFTGRGFRVVAAAAFIGEHSYSTDDFPIAAGRPDADDIARAREFGRSARHLMDSLEGERAAIDIPGTIPYKDGVGNFSFTPVVDQDACTECGMCAEHCPTGAIELEHTVFMAVERCILCASCVKICPEQAISLASTPVREKMVMLNEKCSIRKEPQIFI